MCKTGKPYVFITDCVHADGPDIQNMMDKAREITYRTIAAYCDLSLFPSNPHLSKDWSVRFYKSIYLDKPCYYVCHSAIEYVYCKGQPMNEAGED